MDQREIVLAGLSPAKGASHTPVQVQKLFFLIDQNIPKAIGGPLFEFEPYNYGPFDRTVYDILLDLWREDLVDISLQYSLKRYTLTVQGQKEGEKFLSELPDYAQEYIAEVSQFVRGLSFTELVTSIYKAYPEMREKSVFQG